MPQKKTNKRAKNSSKKNTEDKRELLFKEDGQEYAQVVRLLGGNRLEAFCYDGSTRIAHIRGKMRKRVWIQNGDIILLGLRDFQDNKADVIHRYAFEEAKQLKRYGELPQNARIGESNSDSVNLEIDGNDCAFDFDEI